MSYPNELPQVERLIHDHEELTEEPLVLAVYYATDPASNDVHILEVMDGFGYNQISPDNDLFEVEYGSTSGFRLEDSARLHLVLTSPAEIKHAVQHQWNKVQAIKEAIRLNRYEPVYSTPTGERLLEDLRNAALAA